MTQTKITSKIIAFAASFALLVTLLVSGCALKFPTEAVTLEVVCPAAAGEMQGTHEFGFTIVDEQSTALDALMAFKSLQVEDEAGNVFDFAFEDSTYGAFITEVIGVAQDSGNLSGYYWMFYVNDEAADVGVSTYVIKDGDVISLRLETFMM
ncbi:MAG: DUF4430 domain-containing protein [Eggerthellaceae bacterium]|nr:DUF4430 domain-containing protein [Eggerthellaceae bacterium]